MSIAKSNDNDFFKKLLYGLLEKIIFNEKDFEVLKKAINDITLGKIEPKELKERIIKSRIRILEELIEIFPFYVEQVNNRISINNFKAGDNKNDTEINNNERDEFFNQISHKLDTLYEKIKSNVMG